MRCTARLSSGRQCKHHLKNTYPYCALHTRKILGLKVDKSRLPGAGLGLFATKTFLPNEFIVEYTGERLSRRQMKHLPKSRNCDYVFEISNNSYVDAKDRGSVARYMNDPIPNGLKPNVQFNTYHEDCPNHLSYGGRVGVEATQQINPGEELLVNYGPSYWNRD